MLVAPLPLLPPLPLTTCDSVLLCEAVLPALPLYFATIEWTAWFKLLVLHWAVRVLPEPARATAAQPAIGLTPSVKATVPVGVAPVTAAVKVALVPTIEGFTELDSVVDEGIGPDVPTVQASISATI